MQSASNPGFVCKDVFVYLSIGQLVYPLEECLVVEKVVQS